MSDAVIVSAILGGVGIVAAFVSWLLVLSYNLGVSRSDLSALQKSSAETKETVDKIFDRLDVLSASVPHKCDQVQLISDLRAKSEVMEATLREHGGRMDRIQQGIRDKEQEHNGG